MAMGAMSALAQEGIRIPDDVSVMGYNGIFFTAYAPRWHLAACL
jgi:LacI family transcriptional regulator